MGAAAVPSAINLPSTNSSTFVNGEGLLRRPAHTLTAFGSVELPSRVRAFGDVSVVGVRADRDFSTFPASPIELGGYTDVSVGAAWRVRPPEGGRPGLELTVRVENVLDRAYEQVFGFRSPGRAVYVGGRLEFGGS